MHRRNDYHNLFGGHLITNVFISLTDDRKQNIWHTNILKTIVCLNGHHLCPHCTLRMANVPGNFVNKNASI